MITDKWTLLRCQNKGTVKTRLDNNYLIKVVDIDSLLMTEKYYMEKIEYIMLLEEKEKRLTEIEEVFNSSALLVRDFKVVKANLDYEKSAR